jgi:transcriptional regulator with XRE-family HTH domain
MRGKGRKTSFEDWLKRSLSEDPALEARVAKRLSEMRIEQDLIALRERRGLTQAQLGKMLGISQPAVAKMEAAGGNLEIKTLARAAEVLDARLEIRLVSGHKQASERGVRAYAVSSVHPAVVHDSTARYGSAAGGRMSTRRKSDRATASKKKR